MTPMSVEPPKYRFGPLERRGLIAGWRGGQIAVVAAGLVVGIVSLRAHPNPFGVVEAVAVLASSLAVACWPLGGRTAEEWLPTVARWGADGMLGRRRRSPLPGAGHRPGRAGPAPCDAPSPQSRSAARAAGAFAALRILSVSGERDAPLPGEVGVVHDEHAGTLTAALALESHSFALLGPGEKERRVAGWSGVLAALAREGSSVHRLQWLAMALPDDGRAVHAYLRERATAAPESPARSSYADLLAECGADVSRHDVLLAVQVRRGRRDRGPRGLAAASGALLRELANLARLVADAEVTCLGPLGPADLSAAIRALSEADPPGGSGGAEPCSPAGAGPGSAPWPMATDVEWSRVRTDANWHATYWIAEWPRVDVGPDFLAPVLLGPLRRSVSVVMEPVSPSRAVRAVEAARTADIADSELRRRGGFLATARRAREAELVARRETELADGHGSYRFSGYVTVTAPSAGQLEEWCQATEHAAGQSRLELRRLYGDQERALLCTLPLCRGLS
jgi:hypothetical protein